MVGGNGRKWCQCAPCQPRDSLSESRMRPIRTSDSMSEEWKRSTVSYSGTGNRKGRPHARLHLTHRATPRLYCKGKPASGSDFQESFHFAFLVEKKTAPVRVIILQASFFRRARQQDQGASMNVYTNEWSLRNRDGRKRLMIGGCCQDKIHRLKRPLQLGGKNPIAESLVFPGGG